MNTQEALGIALQFHNTGKLNEASDIYKTILQSEPEHPQALHLQGVVAMQRGKLELAKSLISKAIQVKPDYAEAHNNLGSVLNARKYTREASEQYQKALKINPDFVDALQNMAVLCQTEKKFESSLDYINRILKLVPRHTQALYIKGCLLRQLGRLDASRDCLLSCLELKPDFLEAANELGLICMDNGDLVEAIDLFSNVLAVRSKFFEAQLNLGLALAKTGSAENKRKAVPIIEKAIVMNPQSESAWRKMTELCRDLGEIEKAKAFCDQGLKKIPQSKALRLDCATLCTSLDKYSEAIEHYRIVLASPSDSTGLDVGVYYNMALCSEKVGALEDARTYLNEVKAREPEHQPSKILHAVLLRRDGDLESAVATLESLDESGLSLNEKIQLQFELGKSWDKNKGAQKAFAAFTNANALLAVTGGSSDKSVALGEIHNYQSVVTKAWFESWATVDAEREGSKAPVFLVGFPRSGATMLDQILDSHDKIQVLEERPILQEIELQLSMQGKYYLEALPDITPETLENLRKFYWARVSEYVELASGKVFIDKLPLNIKRIPLIKRLFPEAKIILALRHPCDVVLSNFMQHFRLNNVMSNFPDVDETVHYYDQVMGLWLHYVDVLEPNYSAVKYEDLVEDVQTGAKSVLEFLSLEWDENMNEFYEHAKRRDVRTPSCQQVAHPIYTNSAQRWKRYEEQLAPFKAPLKKYCDAFDYEC
ncbi:MAG: sulfotransferase [Agarilytica sp.]